MSKRESERDPHDLESPPSEETAATDDQDELSHEELQSVAGGWSREPDDSL